jgi:release factor glutamine methyltransferase
MTGVLRDTGGMTIGAAVAASQARLAAAGIESPRREARLLVALATGLEPAMVLGYPDRLLAPDAEPRLREITGRRAAREPVSRIVGKREFWSLELALSPDTLDPRPDSETLVAAALGRLANRRAPLRIVDFGTGTGCLLLALLMELPRAVGFGLDNCPGAAAVARQNAASMSLEKRTFFAVGWWGAALRGTFDVAVANPPYIATGAIPGLAPEVARHDPLRALDGGPDGLKAHRELAPELQRLLSPSGFACVELGVGQAADAARIYAEAGLDEVARHCDLKGVERCLVLAPRR